MKASRRSSPSDREYFFDDGLCFECQGCGDCCTGDPGTVYVAPGEIERIAAHLGISVDGMRHRYCYPFRDSCSLKEAPDGRCCFYDNGCTIYPVRPRQCRSFPFWFDIMRSEKRWLRTARQCPGIGKGRRYSRQEILLRIWESFPGPLRGAAP